MLRFLCMTCHALHITFLNSQRQMVLSLLLLLLGNGRRICRNNSELLSIVRVLHKFINPSARPMPCYDKIVARFRYNNARTHTHTHSSPVNASNCPLLFLFHHVVSKLLRRHNNKKTGKSTPRRSPFGPPSFRSRSTA